MKQPAEKEMPRRVGIFFVIGNVVVSDSIPLSECVPHAGVCDYGGHFEFCEKLKPKAKAERLLKARAYDAFPRGRILFFTKERRFVMYADSCVTPARAKSIAAEFGIRSFKRIPDEHYRCARCNPEFRV